MVYLDRQVRDALGLGFNPAPSIVRDGLLRDARIETPLFSVPARCDDWFVVLANEIGDTGFKTQFIANVVESALSQLSDDLVPAVFKLLTASLSKADSADGPPLIEREEVERILPILLRRILKKWNEDEF